MLMLRDEDKRNDVSDEAYARGEAFSMPVGLLCGTGGWSKRQYQRLSQALRAGQAKSVNFINEPWWPNGQHTNLSRSLAEVGEADFLCFALGVHAGTVPEGALDDLSITEREFAWATELGKPTVAFVPSEKARDIFELGATAQWHGDADVRRWRRLVQAATVTQHVKYSSLDGEDSPLYDSLEKATKQLVKEAFSEQQRWVTQRRLLDGDLEYAEIEVGFRLLGWGHPTQRPKAGFKVSGLSAYGTLAGHDAWLFGFDPNAPSRWPPKTIMRALVGANYAVDGDYRVIECSLHELKWAITAWAR